MSQQRKAPKQPSPHLTRVKYPAVPRWVVVLPLLIAIAMWLKVIYDILQEYYQ